MCHFRLFLQMFSLLLITNLILTETDMLIFQFTTLIKIKGKKIYVSKNRILRFVIYKNSFRLSVTRGKID